MKNFSDLLFVDAAKFIDGDTGILGGVLVSRVFCIQIKKNNSTLTLTTQ